MATVTPNFNWPVPTSTDLVKDGAVAIEALGDSIDASLVDLKGGTSGQVLAKASNTDMDFAWVAQDDSNAIQNSIVDAKGDLIAATANDTPARLAVGTNGQVLTANSATATGLSWATPSGGSNTFYAGKNKIINGDMSISQRGTSFSNPADASYNLDRWKVAYDGTGATTTVSQQTFTPGTSPTGYEGRFFWRWNVSVTGSGNSYRAFQTDIENVQTFAGQTVTVSFWAKADSARTLSDAYLSQRFGSGGSGQVNTLLTLNSSSLTTSWQRFTATTTLPSISGKTVGSSSSLQFTQYLPNGTTMTIDVWGVQLEAGSSATDFVTASGGSPEGEFAMCQRYYERWSLENSNFTFTGFNNSTTNAYHTWHFHTKKRSEPTISVNAAGDFSVRTPGGNITCTAFSTIGQTTDGGWLSTTVASGLTTGNGNFLVNSGSNSFIQASSEL